MSGAIPASATRSRYVADAPAEGVAPVATGASANAAARAAQARPQLTLILGF
jgi:hypothetical protein